MNREIKFRVWDGLAIRYSFLVAGSQFCELLSVMQNKQLAIENYGVHDWEVMQFSGLHDKNDIEVYEGDILRIQLPMGGFWGNVKTQKIGVVKYESDYGAFIVQWEYSKNQHHIGLNCDTAFESEVIGNIYETPELLPK